MTKEIFVYLADIDKEEFDSKFLGVLPEIERSVVKKAAQDLALEIERDGPAGQQNDILKLHRVDGNYLRLKLRNPAVVVDKLSSPDAASRIFKPRKMQTSVSSEPRRQAKPQYLVDFATRAKIRDWRMQNILDKRVRQLNCSQRAANELADDENDSGDRVEYLVSWEKKKESHNCWIPRPVAKQKWPKCVAAFERDYREKARQFIPHIQSKKEKPQQLPRISASDVDSENQLHDLTTVLASTFFGQFYQDPAHISRVHNISKRAEKGHEILRNNLSQDDFYAAAARQWHIVANGVQKVAPEVISSLRNLADRKVNFDEPLLDALGQELLHQEERIAHVDELLATKYELHQYGTRPRPTFLESDFEFSCTIRDLFTWGSKED